MIWTYKVVLIHTGSRYSVSVYSMPVWSCSFGENTNKYKVIKNDTCDGRDKYGHLIGDFPGDTVGKESTCQCRRCKNHSFDSWVGKIPWSRKWQPTPVVLSGKFQGQRSLVGYSPWNHGLQRVGHVWAHTHMRENNGGASTFPGVVSEGYSLSWL